MLYHLSSLSRQELSQLVRQQKEQLLGHDNYHRFGNRLPLDVKFFHNYNPQNIAPGSGSLCYIQRPVLGTGCLVAEIRHTGGAADDISPYLSTAVYDLDDPMTIDYSDLDSFVILICIKGEGTISEGDETSSFRAGNTILLPATTQEITVKGTVKFLETYV